MINFFEKHLGKINNGWKSENSDIQIVSFKNQPFEGLTTYATLGLSNFILKIKEKEVREELVFTIESKFEVKEIPMRLISFAEHIIDTQKGLLRGEVVGPGQPFISGTHFVGLYSSIPAFFEDSFHVNTNITPNVVIVWLIPLFLDEINFIRMEGWNKFEDILEKNDTNSFWDIKRISFTS